VAERYLADENFPAAIVRYLRSQGDEVFFVAESMASASDEGILSAAVAEDRVILTFDSDFGELVIRRQRTAAGVVLFRLKQQSPDVLLPFLMAFFSLRPTLRGFFTVATPNQVRQRRLR
jgi:predicted nuclease of predicted toxin-antitoxin system